MLYTGSSVEEIHHCFPQGNRPVMIKPVIQRSILHQDSSGFQSGNIHYFIRLMQFVPGIIILSRIGRTTEQYYQQLAKVIDFGIARLSKQSDRDKTRFDPGSLGAVSTAYASVEMLLMDDDPDPRDDIYGLACVTYELISGKHAFNGAIAPDIVVV